MGVIHRHPDLSGVGLSQDIGEDQWVLVHRSGFVCPFLHDAVGDFNKLELLYGIGESAGLVCNGPSGNQTLVEDLQVRGVYGVLHGLKPVAVELWLYEKSPSPVLASPDVVFRYDGDRLRPHVGPIEADEFLDRVRFYLNR